MNCIKPHHVCIYLNNNYIFYLYLIKIMRKINEFIKKRHKIKDYEALMSLILCFSFMKTFFYCKIFA